MTTKAKVYALATDLGATIEDDGYRISVEAPKYERVTIDEHELVYDTGRMNGRAGVWRVIWRDLLRGFVPCTDYDAGICEWCVD